MIPVYEAKAHANATGNPVAILIINGIAGWIEASEMAGWIAKFGENILHSVILPMAWIEAHAEEPS